LPLRPFLAHPQPLSMASPAREASTRALQGLCTFGAHPHHQLWLHASPSPVAPPQSRGPSRPPEGGALGPLAAGSRRLGRRVPSFGSARPPFSRAPGLPPTWPEEEAGARRVEPHRRDVESQWSRMRRAADPQSVRAERVRLCRHAMERTKIMPPSCCACKANGCSPRSFNVYRRRFAPCSRSWLSYSPTIFSSGCFSLVPVCWIFPLDSRACMASFARHQLCTFGSFTEGWHCGT